MLISLYRSSVLQNS